MDSNDAIDLASPAPSEMVSVSGLTPTPTDPGPLRAAHPTAALPVNVIDLTDTLEVLTSNENKKGDGDMRNAATLAVVHLDFRFHPEFEEMIEAAVGQPIDYTDTAFGLGGGVLRELGFEFGTIREAEEAKTRVMSLRWITAIRAYVEADSAERSASGGALVPAAT